MPMWMLKRLLMEEKTDGADGGGGDGGSGAADAGAGGADGGKGGAADAGAGDDKGAGKGGAGDGAAGTKEVKATWPENWRDEMAAGDDKLRKQLDRFASPKDVHTAWRSLQQKMSSGELKSTLPKDAKPEDIAKWRTENGIPEKPEGYELPKGLSIGDADKPMVDGFLQRMHAKNAPPELVQEGVRYFYELQEQQAAAIAEADVSHKTEMEDTLRAEWGGEYRANVNAIGAMLETAPGGIKDKILSARMGDGRAILNDPDVLRWLAGTARELNPVATVVPSGGDQMGAITDEIAKIEKTMRENRAAYNKDEKMQTRLRDLYAVRDRKSK